MSERVIVRKANDLTNKTFGKLTTLNIVNGDNKGKVYWNCKCECGNNNVIVRADLLTSEIKTDCGCVNEAKKQQLKNERIGTEVVNRQGVIAKCIEYVDAKNILVEFQDNYKSVIHTTWNYFIKGTIRNPMYPSVHGVGMKGEKYVSTKNYKQQKEYQAWMSMLDRCYGKQHFQRRYCDVTCCDDWHLYDNFYEWLHSQGNFSKWNSENGWHVDKDIIIKGSRVYSPETCVLVPQNVNTLFCKANEIRGDLPIGVAYYRADNSKYEAVMSKDNHIVHLGVRNSPEEAFLLYKKEKENYIKQIANEQYNIGNITKRCYDAMINYEVEITD